MGVTQTKSVHLLLLWRKLRAFFGEWIQEPSLKRTCKFNIRLLKARLRLLVNGGASEESVFWKYVTHVPRLDAILLSHASKTTLPGLKSLIQRKLEEKEEVF